MQLAYGTTNVRYVDPLSSDRSCSPKDSQGGFCLCQRNCVFPEAEGKGVLEVLVVSRKIGQRIHIGDQITITVVKVGSGGVRLGIEAPPEMSVIREELAEKLREAEQRILELAKQSPVETDSP